MFMASCEQGHEVRVNDRFCGQCGQPAFQTTGTPATPAATPQETSRRKTWLIPAGFVAVGALVAIIWAVSSGGSGYAPDGPRFETEEEFVAALLSSGVCNDADAIEEIQVDTTFEIAYNCRDTRVFAYFMRDPFDWSRGEQESRDELTETELLDRCESARESEAAGKPIGSVRGPNWAIATGGLKSLTEIQSSFGGDIRLLTDVYRCA